MTTEMTTEQTEWAQGQFENVEPTQQAVREFDASEDGARYRQITGMTMWENLGGDTLPQNADEA